jgi:N-hydroxyarylamine O-acetyltransferase
LSPIPLDGEEHQQFDRRFRFEQRGMTNVLQGHSGRRWLDVVGLEPGVPQPVDFEVANWYTATYPRSVFQTNLMADLQTAHVRHRLQNRSYTRIVDGVAEDRTLEEVEVPALLREVFQLDVPDGARFIAFDQHAR